jgi:hypothetical protein
MDKRHSSPSPRAALSQRPKTHRKRSNSLPIVEALGCSTPEAELILAEGKAAVRRRFASVQRRGRRPSPYQEEIRRYRPQDHLAYLDMDANAASDIKQQDIDAKAPAHVRTASDATDRSSATITPAAPKEAPEAAKSPTSPLWDYSTNLAKFIQSRLNSISAYNSMGYLRSCPDLPARSITPQSPTRSERRIETPSVIEIPPVRPPLRSAFSAWSSTDESTGDEASPFAGPRQRKASRASNFTPSAILRYYEDTADSSFLSTSTPRSEQQQQSDDKDENISPGEEPTLDTSRGQYETDYPSSTLSTQHSQLTSSSVQSLSSTSTASYFHTKDTKAHPPLAGDQKLPPSQHSLTENVVPAIPPFDGGPISNVHDIVIESRNRIRVDGMTFDLVQSSNVTDGLTETTHCIHPSY